MATLADRIRRVSDLSRPEAEHLRLLCSSWQVLADLSFSDLLLYVGTRKVSSSREETFQVCAQLRPFTSQTLYSNDMVGSRVTQPEQPIVERAFREGRIWAQNDPVLVDGIPIRMDAVPVRFRSRVIGVVTKEGSPAAWRRPGRLEEVYLDAAERVSTMVCEGTFPFSPVPPGDWPRVGDGLFVLDDTGTVLWASPNAISSLRRLGEKQNLTGGSLDDLGIGETPVKAALSSRRLLDGELMAGENHMYMRVMPLVEAGRVTGCLVLSRDVSELRRKDRMLSVKDATIREVHHRVKNNLQTIASLLRLQARRSGSEETTAALRESVLRIGAIALVHETLSEDPSDVAEFADVARRITHMVADGLVMPGREIDLKVIGNTGRLPAEVATPLAVTVTELLQNAIEHAFPDDAPGSISIELARIRDNVVVVVRDDGIGITAGALESARLGLQIVRSLVRELGGSFGVEVDGGTVAEVTVPARRT